MKDFLVKMYRARPHLDDYPTAYFMFVAGCNLINIGGAFLLALIYIGQRTNMYEKLNKKLDFIILYIVFLGFIEVVLTSDIFKAFLTGLMEE